MKYEVIKNFVDSEDKNKKYQVGDSYPNPANKKVNEQRVSELLSADNKLGYAVIKPVEETKKVEATQAVEGIKTTEKKVEKKQD